MSSLSEVFVECDIRQLKDDSDREMPLCPSNMLILYRFLFAQLILEAATILT